MLHAHILKTFVALLLLACLPSVYAQPNYQFNISTTKDICTKASAALSIIGIDPADTITIVWSNGKTNVWQIDQLNAGDYSVNIKIKHQQDTLSFLKDTTLYVVIEKEICPVLIDKYFSPNDDNYHDEMGIVNTQYFPDFELNIFNKWGQQVHSQKKEFTPWDGKWNGIALPDGTYYYIFFYDSAHKTKFIKGDVTILR